MKPYHTCAFSYLIRFHWNLHVVSGPYKCKESTSRYQAIRARVLTSPSLFHILFLAAIRRRDPPPSVTPMYSR